MTKPACYRKLHHYKYQLVRDYSVQIPIKPTYLILTRFITLTMEGKLTIRECYAWDGPSGPTLDTLTFMRGSLIHDALYQLMREGFLDHVRDRKAADEILRAICIEDGMFKMRAWIVYRGVRMGGGKSARPRGPSKREIICAP